MSIKPITYQGASNFRANLYALEVKSRFIDQNAADGYYKGYGDELAAVVSANVITVGTGAFLIQGRLNEIDAGGETVSVTIQNGYVGYIIARIETYHPSDTENCTIFARTGTTLESITLTKEDTYQKGADSQNKVYELPLYSFSMENGAITNLTKLIQPVEENTKTREIADAALAKIKEAYAAIEEMLKQSYVENAGSADIATSLDDRTYYVGGGSQVKVKINPNKIYIIKIYVRYNWHTMVMFGESYSTASAYYGYSCAQFSKDGEQYIYIYDENGNLFDDGIVEWVVIREI